MSEDYKLGPLATDMGLGGPESFYLDVTERGIAIVLGRRLLGYVSADELREVIRASEEQCPCCGQALPDWRIRLRQQQRENPGLTG